jgi:hypothetical protein
MMSENTDSFTSELHRFSSIVLYFIVLQGSPVINVKSSVQRVLGVILTVVTNIIITVPNFMDYEALGLFWLYGLKLLLASFLSDVPGIFYPSVYFNIAVLGFNFQAFLGNFLALSLVSLLLFIVLTSYSSFSRISSLHL